MRIPPSGLVGVPSPNNRKSPMAFAEAVGVDAMDVEAVGVLPTRRATPGPTRVGATATAER